ncbi:serine/threonine-protein kinase [Thalassoroseus pseudoceratinae]|uniref:serine/threonine-protein kinase n=1 Tax=Thalassoroseus pseudoceratinae TaxID=2713176 RepID=UPI001421B47C|nr:serine/threonine-protein kinase [Thalassoroseus pseudoceratinae]
MDSEDRWIWPFELLDQIGEGGMGVVYRARYVVNDRILAVKLLPRDVQDEQALARFERELEILKNLKHKHIVRCFGGACENKRRFYAMELVEGGALDDLLRQERRLPWNKVVEFGQQMAAALAYAHEHQVVHRDVKPGNFLITREGRLKLSDFGLATVAAARKITSAGKTMGTFHYMAPEQIRGQTMTGQVDLYALGCVFYELLTGRPPFEADTPAAILHKHIQDTANPIRSLNPDCPEALAKLVHELLEKKPTDRPASAQVVQRRLEEISSIVVVEPRRRASESRVGNQPVGRPLESLRNAELNDTKTVATPATEADIPTYSPNWSLPIAAGVAAVIAFWVISFLTPAPSSASAERLWIDAFQSGRTAEIRVEAAMALGELSSTSENAAEVLRSALEQIEAEPTPVRVAIVDALGESGYAARNKTPALRKLQKADPEESVRTHAADAITKINAAEPPGRPWTVYAKWFIALTATGIIAHALWKNRQAT